MDPVTIISLLGGVVPQIVGWLKGPEAGNKAEIVVQAARKFSGIDDPLEAIREVSSKPELLIQLRQVIIESELQETRAHLEDIQNARNMQISALDQDDLFSKRFAYLFAMGWSIFAAVYFFSVTFSDIPEKGLRFADTILGFLLGTGLSGIFSWLYGSTRRSATKDNTTLSLTSTLGQLAKGLK